MSKQVNVSTGVGPMGLLWVAFIVMKLAHIIDWSWLIVFCWPIPVWVLMFAVALLIVGFSNRESFI